MHNQKKIKMRLDFESLKPGQYKLMSADFGFSEWSLENKVVQKAIKKFIDEIKSHSSEIEEDRVEPDQQEL